MERQKCSISRKLREVVVINSAACPLCGGSQVTTQRAIDNGDGTRTRIAVCDDSTCRCRFDIVVEPLIQNLDGAEAITVTIPASDPTQPRPESNTMTTSVLSIGRCAQRLQATVQDVREVAMQLGVQPTLTINGVDHFSERDLRYIAERMQQLRGLSVNDRRHMH